MIVRQPIETYQPEKPVYTILNASDVVMLIKLCLSVTVLSHIVLFVPGCTETAAKVPFSYCIFVHYSENCTLGNDRSADGVDVSKLLFREQGFEPTSLHAAS